MILNLNDYNSYNKKVTTLICNFHNTNNYDCHELSLTLLRHLVLRAF